MAGRSFWIKINSRKIYFDVIRILCETNLTNDLILFWSSESFCLFPFIYAVRFWLFVIRYSHYFSAHRRNTLPNSHKVSERMALHWNQFFDPPSELCVKNSSDWHTHYTRMVCSSHICKSNKISAVERNLNVVIFLFILSLNGNGALCTVHCAQHAYGPANA